MRVMVEGPRGVVLDVSADNPNVLLPPKSERAVVFRSLIDALALVSGITQLHSFDAKEGALDQRCSPNLLGRDGHMYRVDEPQSELQEREGAPTTSVKLRLVSDDC